MRDLPVSEITQAVKQLFIEANYTLPPDLQERMACAACREQNLLGKQVLNDLLENLEAAKTLQVPICQDTGMAVLFLRLGQEVHLTGGCLQDAVDEGVRQAYLEGNLRCSMVRDPLRRENTNDNTPAVLHLELTEGDQVELLAAPKGFGSENMSRIQMLPPSASPQEVAAFVRETVRLAGSNPCPPIVVGVGLGGDFELAALLSKKALCRPVSEPHPDPFYADLETSILEDLNRLDIGPQGFGGNTTALAVHIETYPTHIAGLPAAVNIGCHVTRHQRMVL